MLMRQHRQQPPHEKRVGAYAVLGQIPFEQQPQVVLPPRTEVTAQGIRKPTLQPDRLPIHRFVRVLRFAGGQRIQLDDRRPPGQRFRHAAYQRRLCRAKNDEPSVEGSSCIDRSPQRTEHR